LPSNTTFTTIQQLHSIRASPFAINMEKQQPQRQINQLK